MNKKSGSGSSVKRKERLEQIFRKYNIEAEVNLIKGKHIQKVVSRKLNSHYDTIIACGGDGTISAVAGAITNTDITLGVIPLGTFNHFAKDNGIPLNIEKAVDIIAQNNIELIDTAEVNDIVFVNNSSIGLYTRMVKIRELYKKSGYGKISALLITLFNILIKVIFRLPAYRFIVHTENYKKDFISPFVFIGNNEYNTGLLNFGSREGLDEGELSLYYIECESNKSLLGVIFDRRTSKQKLLGDFSDNNHKKIKIGTNRKKLYVSVDGEIFKMSSRLTYRTMPKSLRLIKPVKKVKT